MKGSETLPESRTHRWARTAETPASFGPGHNRFGTGEPALDAAPVSGFQARAGLAGMEAGA
jgi:hypothetical protein